VRRGLKAAGLLGKMADLPKENGMADSAFFASKVVG